MQTETIEKTETQPIADVAQSQGDVATFKPPRLPWHDAIGKRFPEVDKGSWKALVEAIYPNAKSVDAVILALTYCKARHLDPFKRPVHIVPMWDSKAGAYSESVWPSISELRTTAFRTGQYAGCDEAEFGPLIEKAFTGEMWENKKKVEKTIKVTFPEWARITIRRIVQGHVVKFVGPKVLWLESYATVGKSDLPNEMWRDRAVGQIEKCSEAAALRRAFPEELGNEYAAEEMEGRRKLVDVTETAKALTQVTLATEPAKAAGEPPKQATITEASVAAAASQPIAGQAQATDGAPDLDFDITEGKPPTGTQTPAGQAQAAEAQIPLDGVLLPPEKTRDKDDVFLEYADKTLSAVNKAEDLETVWNTKVYPRLMKEVGKDRQADGFALWRKHEIRLGID